MYKRILFITPPEGLSKGKVHKPAFTYQPLYFGFLAGALKKIGVDVKILDAYVLVLTGEQILTEILNWKPDVIGLSGTTPYINNSYSIAKIIRENNIDVKIILGGIHVTSLYKDMIKEQKLKNRTLLTELFNKEIGKNELFDHIFIGEGEKSIIKFIKGEVDDRIIIGEPIMNLDELEYVAYDLFLPFNYFNLLPHLGLTKFFPMVTSRGCPYNCDFCSVAETQGRKYRFRSAPSIVEEIQFLQQEYNISGITFREGDFTTNKNRVLEFCELLLEKNITLSWNCNSHINDLDEKMIKLMKRSGCTNLQIGIEFADEIRRKRFKGGSLTNKKIFNIIKCCKKYSLTVHTYYMFGMPGETKNNIWDTIRMAKALDTESVVFAIATPYPGTKFWNYCIDNNMISDWDWDHYHGHKQGVYTPENFTMSDLRFYMKLASWLFYFRPKKIWTHLKKVNNLKDIINLLKVFYNFLLWGQ